MRLLALHLKAFGPFTERWLDLSAGRHGLHLVYGPNEAGKSSALRALRGLLYGIDERTADNFLHDNRRLRVGARLRLADGTEFTCYRRKGRKDTLLDADERPLQPDPLAPLLAGVDERLFRRLFGIDHAALVEGGEALLEERGQEAEALFGSGLGGGAVHRTLAALDTEARELFAPRAQNPAINAALGRLQKVERELREATLSARAWEEARRELDRRGEELAAAQRRLQEASRHRAALERARRVLPALARRDERRRELDQLGPVPDLPGDFGPRRRAAEDARREARQTREDAERRRRRAAEAAEAVSVDQGLLDQAESVEALYRRLDGQRLAAEEIPRARALRDSHREQAARLLAEARPGVSLEAFEALRALPRQAPRVTELEVRRNSLEEAAAELAASLDQARRRRDEARAALEAEPDPPDVTALEQALGAARRPGDLDAALIEGAAGLEQQRREAERDLAALGLWPGDLAALARAALPSTETLRRQAERERGLADRRRDLERRRDEAREQGGQAETILRALELGGQVPTEAELDQARRRRDRGWILLRRQWERDEDVAAEAADYDAGLPLADAFQGAMAGADELADRLRREADRVHRQAGAQADAEDARRRLDEAEAALEEHAARAEQWRREWQALWQPWGLEPRPPAEMIAWRDAAEHLRARCARLEDAAAAQERLEARAAALATGLAGALEALGEAPRGAGPGLAPLLEQAERLLEDAGRRRRERQRQRDAEAEAQRRCAELEAAQRRARERLQAWRQDWDALLGELGLEAGTGAAQALAYLNILAQVGEQLDQARAAERSLEQARAAVEDFRAAASELVSGVAPCLAGRPAEEAVARLHTALGKARQARTLREQHRQAAAEAGQSVEQAGDRLARAEAELAELVRLAGCAGPEQLAGVEARAERARELARQLAREEAELAEAGDGRPLAELREEVAGLDRDALRAELAALETRLTQELDPEYKRLLQARSEAQQAFQGMAGDDAAARLAEEAAQLRAELREQAEHYLRLRLAARVLRDEIEAYRRRHRDPILARATAYFQKLTCGAFQGVDARLDDNDQPLLVGLRPDGEALGVEAMSTGSRDQLYLALRLASLEHFLERLEPLPFVVDDVLVQFDDARTRATLEALAEFSRHTQVIVFSHHRRVREEVQALASAGADAHVQSLE